ncbi:sensor histidine kinase [Nonomuraea jiangxiensis]|uniref:histidine kinase n=1 Tax=Nonomuraea jiangxiensis TaxID=633440 RepID=A0A1G9R092_9ACTN|nr:histidine kinase [Nonomuraea jiangxiensis]SDM16623.1 Signal transduction histidine kinase [Nonomuraea jiangxiensis]
MRFALLGAGVGTLTLFSLHGQGGVRSGLPLPALVAIAAVTGVAAWYARRSWWPLAVVGAVAYAWLVLWPPLLVATYFAGRSLRGRGHLAAYVGGSGVAIGLSVAVGQVHGGTYAIVTGAFGNTLVMALAMIGLPLALGLWTRARREVLAAARERAERLEHEQVMRAEQARAQERARIAREMHDVVAHRVSLIVLHAGALEVRAADEETARAAALIGGIGREALTNLRDVLGVLRSPPSPGQAGDLDRLRPPPTLDDLDRLLDQSRALGIAVTRHDEGEIRPVETTVERTAYRVVQEALTNVHKHAGDVGTDVRLRYGPDALEVEVRNDAPGAAREELPGAGWGLVGLRERVELLGGTLRTSAEDGGGFLVRARIPG